MKSNKDEYIRQAEIRDWAPYLGKLPFYKESVVLDFGCGIGAVTHLLSHKYSKVFGFDENPELIDEAKRRFAKENLQFIVEDVRELERSNLFRADGIWCSFAAAYFPDLETLLSKWAHLLNPGGWIALVEVNDMFNHAPLSEGARQAFTEHAQRLFEAKRYDVMMGSKLRFYTKGASLKIIFESEMRDPELAFRGPATSLVISAWNDRFERMGGFKRDLGEFRFGEVKDEFLCCLSKEEHTCFSTVNFLIAQRVD